MLWKLRVPPRNFYIIVFVRRQGHFIHISIAPHWQGWIERNPGSADTSTVAVLQVSDIVTRMQITILHRFRGSQVQSWEHTFEDLGLRRFHVKEG